MAGETDQTFHIISEAVVNEAKTASGAESNILMALFSSNAAAEKMANKTTPTLSDYWKMSMVTKAYHSAYHATG
jgi:hypothetical protein